MSTSKTKRPPVHDIPTCEVARELGVTRERVRQIAVALGLGKEMGGGGKKIYLRLFSRREVDEMKKRRKAPESP